MALHELTHWTGAQHRLARDFAKRFGTEAHAFEELIAELGSAFLNAELGFSAAPIPNHAGYIESWLKVLKNDKRAIFTDASQAQQGAPLHHGYGGGNRRAEGEDSIANALVAVRLGPTVRELSALGEVFVGMCSSHEFIVM